MRVVDLDALRPKSVRVRYGDREYDVRRDLPTARAIELMDLLQQFEGVAQAPWQEQRALIERLPREAAALMADDEVTRDELVRSLAPDVAAMVIALALGRDRGEAQTPQQAAKGKRHG